MRTEQATLTPAPLWPRLAIAGIVVYHTMLFALIGLRPDLDPDWHVISEYAIGDYGWMMALGFWSAAASYASLFAAIRADVRGGIGTLGLTVFVLCLVGLIGVGLFRTDPMTTPPDLLTRTGTVHLIAGGSQLALLPVAALLINLKLAFWQPAWRSARAVLVATGFLPLAALIAFAAHYTVYVAPLGENAYGPGVPLGWPSRLLFLAYAVWLITLARLRIARTHRD